MSVTKLQSFVIVWILTQIVPTSGQWPNCLGCTSEKFLNSDFSNFDLLEDVDCEKGVNRTDFALSDCSYDEVCSTIDGIASYAVQGYGTTKTKFVARSCIARSHFGDGAQCMSGNEANAFVTSLNHALEIDGYVVMSSFQGSVCYCDTGDYCNNVSSSPIVVRRSHTPAPGAKGLQCATCVDLNFGYPWYDHYDYDNPSCEDGDLSDGQVYYNTCSGDGVCAVIDGKVEEFGVSYDLYQRVCVHGLEDYLTRSNDLVCVSRSDASVIVPDILSDEDYYYFGYDITFDGKFCYCSTDFCTLPGRSENREMQGGAPETPSVRPLALALMIYASWFVLR